MKVYDLPHPDRPEEITSKNVDGVTAILEYRHGEKPEIEERTYHGIGTSRATILVRNGQIEHILFPPSIGVRCEVDPGQNPVPLVCVCK